MIFKKERIIDICFMNLKPLWLSTSKEFPTFFSAAPEETKIMNETFIHKNSGKLSKHWGKLSTKKMQWLPFYRKKWTQNTESLLKQFLWEESILNLSSYLSPDKIASMSTELKKFLYSARQFAPDLSVSDLGQAVRNYLVYAIFLELIGKEQQFTPAIFGYSMLYPITDNYIDSARSSDQKHAYNMMIRDKIKGIPVSPESSHDILTCKLLSYIESVYPHDKDADIFSGLALMLEAQQESLSQQAKEYQLSMEERLNISLYKGGISVLIDRYFADSHMSDDELQFFLGFGFILQLADDLQDISSDLLEGSQTLFTLDPNPNASEALVNQLLQFIHQLFESFTFANADFQEFLLQSSIYLILMSAQMSQQHFNKDYLQKLETYFPVHFTFMDQYTKNSAIYPKGIQEKDLLQGIDLFLKDGIKATED